MTTSKGQEAFGLVIDRHIQSVPESDIRSAFQRFMETAGVAAASDMTTEKPPGVGNPGRMDLYVHNTCIEFKTNILRGGTPEPEYVGQLDGYLKNLLKNGTGVRNGILTDGVHYFLRRVGEEDLPVQRHAVMQIFDRAEQAPRLREYLHSISWVRSENISPTAENLERHFGNTSDAFLAGNLLLKEAYEAHRDDSTVAVKRRLWQDLLQVALGKDAATAMKVTGCSSGTRCGNCSFFSPHQLNQRKGYCLAEPKRVETQRARPACRHWQLVGWHTLDIPESEVLT